MSCDASREKPTTELSLVPSSLRRWSFTARILCRGIRTVLSSPSSSQGTIHRRICNHATAARTQIMKPASVHQRIQLHSGTFLEISHRFLGEGGGLQAVEPGLQRYRKPFRGIAGRRQTGSAGAALHSVHIRWLWSAGLRGLFMKRPQRTAGDKHVPSIHKPGEDLPDWR